MIAMTTVMAIATEIAGSCQIPHVQPPPKVVENTGTTPTTSIHGFGLLAPSGAGKRMRRRVSIGSVALADIEEVKP